MYPSPMFCKCTIFFPFFFGAFQQNHTTTSCPSPLFTLYLEMLSYEDKFCHGLCQQLVPRCHLLGHAPTVEEGEDNIILKKINK